MSAIVDGVFISALREHLSYLRHDRRGEPGGTVEEFDTLHCRHCNAIVPMRSRFEGVVLKKEYLGHWCGTCGGVVCQQQGCDVCVSFLRKVDAKHQADRDWARIIGG